MFCLKMHLIVKIAIVIFVIARSNGQLQRQRINDHDHYENPEFSANRINHPGNADVSFDNCSCVPYYQCSDDSGHVVTDGDGLFDVRLLDEENCTGYLDVCCNISLPSSTPSPFIALKTTAGSSYQSNYGCGFLKKMVVPWSGILQIQTNQKQQWMYKCGLSIIHPQIAITAAHCLLENESVWNYRVKVADYMSKVVKLLKHPSYNPSTLQNDIALIVLKDELTYVGTICIPPPSTVFEITQCAVNTWKNGRLRIIQLPLVQNDKCEKLLRKTRLGPYFQLHASFVCAGGNNFQDACDGDGGSPLICPVSGQPGRYHQVGIVSWGIGCGTRDTPGVYVNLAVFRNWIDDVIQYEILNGTYLKNSKIKDGINTYRY